MIVIKKSKKPTWVKQYRCTGAGNNLDGCNSLLEVSKGDLVYWPGVSGQCYGNRNPVISFKCCVCGEPNDIPEKDWPNNTDKLPRVDHNWYK